jgi:hypothetical protein
MQISYKPEMYSACMIGWYNDRKCPIGRTELHSLGGLENCFKEKVILVSKSDCDVDWISEQKQLERIEMQKIRSFDTKEEIIRIFDMRNPIVQRTTSYKGE